MTPATVLTVGGSDSAGNHGIQADLRTFAALGAHGACAVTVVTAQDTVAVHAATALPTPVVAAQLDAVIADLGPVAAKTGMLGRADIVELVADRLGGDGHRPLVVDPVLVDKTGRPLFGEDVLAAYRRLLPRARVVTPNRPEAELLAGGPLADLDAFVAFAAGTGTAVVLTGGRDGRDRALDVLWDGQRLHRFDAPRIDTPNVAGTGDAFSAALAVHLGRGVSLPDAVGRAKDLVGAAVQGARSWRLGRGPGPIDHLGWAGGDPPS